jgi:ABC-type Zn uptake system ZnuABC Zn-binding protein ZnuA
VSRDNSRISALNTRLIRRRGWISFNLVAAIFLATAALAACTDEDRQDSAAGNPTSTSQTAGSATNSEIDAEPLNVVVTMPFFPSMVETVGGERVEVQSIVPPGVDAHTYQPSPGDARMIADADLIFVNGLGLEGFLDDLIESAGGVDAPIIVLADGLQEYGIETDGHHHHDDDGHHHEDDGHHHDDDDYHHADDDHHHDDDHGHGHDDDDNHHADDHGHGHEDDDDHHHDDNGHGHDDDHHHHGDDHHHDHDYPYGNPHFWLSPEFGIHYAERISEGLIEKDPENEAFYRSNADGYISEIEEFDEWAREEMGKIPETNRKMVTFHDAFPYFADHYGLEVVGVVISSPGRDPGARELAQLADEIRDAGVPAVFIEPQFNPQLAEAIADEAGVSTQLIYSDTPPEGVGYLEMMRLNVESVVKGLS